jgi:hypothetical protein
MRPMTSVPSRSLKIALFERCLRWGHPKKGPSSCEEPAKFHGKSLPFCGDALMTTICKLRGADGDAPRRRHRTGQPRGRALPRYPVVCITSIAGIEIAARARHAGDDGVIGPKGLERLCGSFRRAFNRGRGFGLLLVVQVGFAAKLGAALST